VPLARKATNFELNMGDNSIEQTNETKHLGLMRNSDNKIKQFLVELGLHV
jgi:hypothetical protein